MIIYGKTNTHSNIKKASTPRTSRLCLRSRGVIAGHMKWYLSNMDELNGFDNYSLISAGVWINRYHSLYDKSKPVYRTCYFIFVGTVMLIQSNMFFPRGGCVWRTYFFLDNDMIRFNVESKLSLPSRQGWSSLFVKYMCLKRGDVLVGNDHCSFSDGKWGFSRIYR